jgi:hypothetical protein
MKKKLIIALCGLLSLTLFACKSGDDDNPSSKVQVKTSTTATKTDSEESGGTGSQETPAEPVKVTSVFIIVPDYLEVGDEDVIYVLTEPEGQPVKISCDTDVIELLDADCGQLDDKTWAFFIKAKKIRNLLSNGTIRRNHR